MAIRYALFPNSLTPDPDDYLASVQAHGTANFEFIAERMLANGSVLSKADILALLESTTTACIGLLLEGRRISFGGLFELTPSIQGVFESPTDSFDPARHRLSIGGGPGHRVRREVAQRASVEKVEGVKPAPNPIAYRDFASGTENDVITPGSIGTLLGHRLKVNPAEADEGLFILNAGTGAEVQRIVSFQKNKPGELVWLNPGSAGLPSGAYRLEVRARYKSNELRTGSLGSVLTSP